MKCANEVWLKNLKYIYENGAAAHPRGIESKEIISYQSRVAMSHPVVSILKRKLSFQFMAAEALWILEQDNRVSSLSTHAPSIKRFSDDGETLYGAYGPQIIPQLDYVINTLLSDLDTRQAVASIWIRNPKKSFDIPCTIAVQWLIRDGKLHCVDTMRSSDLWLGWPYDIFSFTMLTCWVALALREKGINIDLGEITLHAASQHLYKSNFDSAIQCLNCSDSLSYRPLTLDIFESTTHLKDTLRRIKSGSNSTDYWLSDLVQV